MVFISYSTLDGELADSIREKLKERGVDCWMASESIAPGSDYASDIPAAIAECDAVIVLLSANSQDSTWVPKELDIAISMRKLIIPLHIDSSEISVKFRFYFSNVQQLEAQHKLEQALDMISAVLQKKLRTPSAASVASDLPDRITLYELLNVARSKDIDISRLRRNNDVTRSLAVPIGKNDRGETLELDIHQKGDGPNGIVFGPSGTGKKEFISTFLISLALNYSPEDVCFYLVDFRKSDCFLPLSRLPHMAGLLMEENDEAIREFCGILRKELRKREEQLQQAGVQNAYQYMKKQKNEGSPLPPMPHMVIAASDFGGIKSRQPEFAFQIVEMAELKNAEHYGIHVLYTTRNAAGVVNGRMYETLNYRICSSMPQYYGFEDDIPDTETVFHPGRLYFGSPTQDTIQLIQLAYSDAISMPAMTIGKAEQNEFFWQFFHKKQSDALVDAIIRYEMD